ncbi:hypothetical protein QD357_29875 [Rhizobium sp. BR 317]|uniref:VOC family protein n=1 Tax=Rhizobium sp. BR 317 TaxID=3040015 RepID=UPI0039BF0229
MAIRSIPQDIYSLGAPLLYLSPALPCGSLEVHLIVNPAGTFRKSPTIDRNDWHFAFRTDDFDGVVKRLADLGFRDDLPESDPKCLLIFRSGPAHFPQLYLRDPDLNVVEVNGAL